MKIAKRNTEAAYTVVNWINSIFAFTWNFNDTFISLSEISNSTLCENVGVHECEKAQLCAFVRGRDSSCATIKRKICASNRVPQEWVYERATSMRYDESRKKSRCKGLRYCDALGISIKVRKSCLLILISLLTDYRIYYLEMYISHYRDFTIIHSSLFHS